MSFRCCKELSSSLITAGKFDFYASALKSAITLDIRGGSRRVAILLNESNAFQKQLQFSPVKHFATLLDPPLDILTILLDRNLEFFDDLILTFSKSFNP